MAAVNFIFVMILLLPDGHDRHTEIGSGMSCPDDS
jgi:hypothetical protein